MSGNQGMGRGYQAAALGSLIALAACGTPTQRDTGSGPGDASVSLAITQAPSDVSCVRVVAAGARTVNAAFDVKAAQSTVFEMGGLPIGTVSFRAEAFTGPCADPPGEATYASDSITRTLKPGKNDALTLTMRARAAVSVAVDFPGLGPDATWTSFDSSPQGTPALAEIDPASSSADQTVFNLQLHGLYAQQVTGPDGRAYQKLFVPGLGALDQVGGPQLPVLRVLIALLNSADVTVASAEAAEQRTLTGMVPYPSPKPERDSSTSGAPGSSPEEFVRDASIYDGRAPFPADPAAVLEQRQPMLGAIEGAALELRPVRFDPATGAVTVVTKFRVTVSHKGEARIVTQLDREQFEEAQSTFANWAQVSQLVQLNTRFTGQFLFVYPGAFHDELQPLVQQKKARGFTVTETTTEETGATCAGVRAAIAAWRAKSPSGDHYVQLVGDTNVIPLCKSPNNLPTDDLYGSTNGDDLHPEVLVGRLAAIAKDDLSFQVQKILRYEDAPSSVFNYGRALLVAHAQGAPGKYVGAQEVVRTASYAVPPSFSTVYGSVPGIGNEDVVAAIDAGQGLVAYRGHGSETEWWNWNLAGLPFSFPEIMSLNNAAQETPVVWSFACSNAALDSSPSIAELWLRSPEHGAVSHYGATVPSATLPNHVLDQKMFAGVYDKNLTTQSKAIRWAEAQMRLAYPADGTDNSWMYLLLGDPEMRIRRRPVFEVGQLFAPEKVLACAGAAAGCTISLRVTDRNGKPLRNALVSIYQGDAKQDLVADNGYTDDAGLVRLSIDGSQPGPLQARARVGGDELPAVQVQLLAQ
jgi:hypothetical protein